MANEKFTLIKTNNSVKLKTRLYNLEYDFSKSWFIEGCTINELRQKVGKSKDKLADYIACQFFINDYKKELANEKAFNEFVEIIFKQL